MRYQLHFFAVKHYLYFATILKTLQRCFQNCSENQYIDISEICLQRIMN